MATLRWPGGSVSLRTPPMTSAPLSICSKPAIMRKKVDLPDPEGPRNTTNSPSLIARERFSMTDTWPNFLDTLSNKMSAMVSSSIPSFPILTGSQGLLSARRTLRVTGSFLQLVVCMGKLEAAACYLTARENRFFACSR